MLILQVEGHRSVVSLTGRVSARAGAVGCLGIVTLSKAGVDLAAQLEGVGVLRNLFHMHVLMC